MPQKFEISRELSPFGVEIDFDMRTPLDEDAQAMLQRLRLKHHLLVFRNQKLSLADQERVMKYMGPILEDEDDRMDFISTDDAVGILGNGEIAFHSDLAFTPHPFPTISLHAVDVTDGATSTTFASGTLAFQALPEAMKARLRGLQALHCMAKDNENRTHDLDVPPEFPRSVHPLVMPHPESGEPILFAFFQQTDRILGLPEETSEALLNALFVALYAPGNMYEHRWNKGDFVIWDNIALQHARLEKVTTTRTLQRVTGGRLGLRMMYPITKELFGESVAGIVARAALARKAG